MRHKNDTWLGWFRRLRHAAARAAKTRDGVHVAPFEPGYPRYSRLRDEWVKQKRLWYQSSRYSGSITGPGDFSGDIALVDPAQGL